MRTEWDTTAGSIALGIVALLGFGGGAYLLGRELAVPPPGPTLLAGLVGVAGFLAVSYLYFALLLQEQSGA